MLSGKEIIKQIEKGSIVIEPFDVNNVGPNSYFLHIADELVVYEDDILDCKRKSQTRTIKIPKEGYVLRPGELYLSRTIEYTETLDHIPVLHGHLGLASLGIAVHITAGFGDVGFKGTWTLEIFCIKPVRIYPGMKVCHICYFPVVGEATIKYQGRYLGQIDTRASRFYEDFEKVEK